MSYVKDRIEYRGHTITIADDQDPMNPRTEWDNAGTMVCWHSRYNLGDVEYDSRKSRSVPMSKNYNEPIDLLYELAGVYRDEYLEEHDDDMSGSELYAKIEERGIVILPLSLYDHSGITMYVGSPSCNWDSGYVGYIYMTKETRESNNWTIEQAIECLKSEVEVYDNYLTGEVWRFIVEDSDGEEVDSCSGYYGDNGVKDAIEEAKSIIDYQCEKAQIEYEKQPKKKAAEHYML